MTGEGNEDKNSENNINKKQIVKTKKIKHFDKLLQIIMSYLEHKDNNAKSEDNISPLFQLKLDELGNSFGNGMSVDFYGKFNTYLNQNNVHIKMGEKIETYPVISLKRIQDLLLNKDMSKSGGVMESKLEVVSHVVFLIEKFINPALIVYQKSKAPIDLDIREKVLDYFRGIITKTISIMEGADHKMLDYDRLSPIIQSNISDVDGYKNKIAELKEKIKLNEGADEEHQKTKELILNSEHISIKNLLQRYVCLSNFVNGMINSWKNDFILENGDVEFFKKHESKLKDILLENLKKLLGNFTNSIGKHLICAEIHDCNEDKVYFKDIYLEKLFYFLSQELLEKDKIMHNDGSHYVVVKALKAKPDKRFNETIKFALQEWFDWIRTELEPTPRSDEEEVVINKLYELYHYRKGLQKPTLNTQNGEIKNTEGTVGIVEEQKKSVSNGKEEYSDTNVKIVGSTIPKLGMGS